MRTAVPSASSSLVCFEASCAEAFDGGALLHRLGRIDADQPDTLLLPIDVSHDGVAVDHADNPGVGLDAGASGPLDPDLGVASRTAGDQDRRRSEHGDDDRNTRRRPHDDGRPRREGAMDRRGRGGRPEVEPDIALGLRRDG